MLLKAIERKAGLPELTLLLQRKLENFSDSQRAHILIRILDIYPEEQMDILEIFCQRFSAEIIGCTDQKGMSPIVRAVELQRLRAVKIFVAKSPKKIKFPPPQWQKAAKLASEKQYQAIENVLVEKVIKIAGEKKESLPDNRSFLRFKDKFVDTHTLLHSVRDFTDSIINGVDKSAEQQIQTVALQGTARAQFLLASLLKEKKDNEGYLYWLEKSASGGNASAQFELGIFYFKMEVKEGRKKSVEWFRKAAEQGLAQAQTNLGVCYQFSIGVAVNHDEAIKWYLKAAEHNCSVAQNNLALYYLKGIHSKEERANGHDIT